MHLLLTVCRCHSTYVCHLIKFRLNFLQFVSASQPITAVAYIFDGLHYGISDFSYAAYSMVSHLLRFVILHLDSVLVVTYAVTFIYMILNMHQLCSGCGGSNFFCVFIVCSKCLWSLWSLVWFDSFHGLTCGGWMFQVNLLEFCQHFRS